MIILGVIASILLAGGLIPPYFEIWKRRGRVIGINWVMNVLIFSVVHLTRADLSHHRLVRSILFPHGAWCV